MKQLSFLVMSVRGKIHSVVWLGSIIQTNTDMLIQHAFIEGLPERLWERKRWKDTVLMCKKSEREQKPEMVATTANLRSLDFDWWVCSVPLVCPTFPTKSLSALLCLSEVRMLISKDYITSALGLLVSTWFSQWEAPGRDQEQEERATYLFSGSLPTRMCFW